MLPLTSGRMTTCACPTLAWKLVIFRVIPETGWLSLSTTRKTIETSRTCDLKTGILDASFAAPCPLDCDERGTPVHTTAAASTTSRHACFHIMDLILRLIRSPPLLICGHVRSVCP